MKFCTLTREQYDAFASKHEYANFLNSVYSKDKIELGSNWKGEFVGVVDKEEVVAATLLTYIPLRNKKCYFYAPRGFLIDYRNKELLNFFCSALLKHMKELNGLYLKIDPYVPYQQHDMNGDIVEGGFNNQDMIDNLVALGYEHQGFTKGYDESVQCRWMSVLDLQNTDEKTLLKNMDSQTRWAINKTLKLGIRVREIGEDELYKFDQIMKHTSVRRGFSDTDESYYHQQMQTYGKGNIIKFVLAELDLNEYEATLNEQIRVREEELVEVEKVLSEIAKSKKFNKRKKVLLEEIEDIKKKIKDNEELWPDAVDGVLTLAGSSFMIYGKEVVYLTSGAYDKYMKLNASYAIQWYMIRYALERSIPNYNFYGISGLFDPESEGYGVFNFKRGFRADVVELLGEFILPVDKRAYKNYLFLQKMKSKLKGH
ncbi:MAG: peptidoglycan bridge formation glycyltransferase FemA/FemB family protein [Firmicutes bacterium]|nr:peptidoglycan bridge formation glycyltransferase FemA/FemB family protein [Bacillota bacterium]